MKSTTYILTILTILGSYTSLQGDCLDGRAKCNDGTLVYWSCVYQFPGCQARDYDSSEKAAEALCANRGGVNWNAALDPLGKNPIYRDCFI